MNEWSAWFCLVGVVLAISSFTMMAAETERQTRYALEVVLRHLEQRSPALFAHLAGRRLGQTQLRPGHDSGCSPGAQERQSAITAAQPERRSAPRRRIEDVFPGNRTRRGSA